MTEHEATGTHPDVPQESLNALPTIPAALENLLSTNDAPSEADILILRELHALFSAHLTRLDDEIASSGKIVTLERLKEDRAVLLDRSRQVLGALSTLRRFPREVLQEIFLKLIPDAGFEVLDPRQGAWAVGRVCSSWRSASRHPHLWTTFRIKSDGCGCVENDGPSHRRPAFIRYKNPVELLQTALRSSGSCNLDLHIEIRHDCSGNGTHVQNLLDALMAHSDRWERLSLMLPSELGMALVGVRGRVPELRCLTFVGCDPEEFWEDHWAEGDDLPVIRAFEVAPRLKRVSVNNALLRLNYPLLTSFTSKFHRYFPHPVPPLFVIGHCPDLVHLDDFAQPAEDDNLETIAVVPRISNTSLMRLIINDPTLLASLSLPALLSLDVGDMSGMSCLPFIPPFLDASQCSLTKLHFRNSTLSGTPLAHILQLIPCLTDLGIGFHLSWNTPRDIPLLNGALCELIKNLSEVDGSETRHRFVPKLESIAFESTSSFTKATYWTFVGPELADMLHSREGILRKASFRLHIRPVEKLPNLGESTIVALRGIKDRGLEIAICNWIGKSLL